MVSEMVDCIYSRFFTDLYSVEAGSLQQAYGVFVSVMCEVDYLYYKNEIRVMTSMGILFVFPDTSEYYYVFTYGNGFCAGKINFMSEAWRTNDAVALFPVEIVSGVMQMGVCG